MAFEDFHRPMTSASFRGAIKWIVLVSGALLVGQQFTPTLVHVLGLTPVAVLREHWWWQPVTYLFLHGGIFHWLFNMFVLWMFGRELESRWGTAYFVRYFFVTGIGAGLCVLALSPNSTIPTIGASGAVFGILVAFAMLFPETVLYLYFVLPVKAWQLVVVVAFIEFFAGLQGGGAGLGRFAHLGGMATGYIYLRFGGFLVIRTGAFRRGFVDGLRRLNPIKKKRPVVFHEVTDDLVKEVDRILEKILKDGVDSLSENEKQIMQRYSKLKH